jgi:hypothetical protein
MASGVPRGLLLFEIEALQKDLERMEDPRAKFLELAIIELEKLQ